MNAYNILAVENTKAGMFFELTLYVGYVVGLVTTANRNIEKYDKKKVEKRNPENIPYTSPVGRPEILRSILNRKVSNGTPYSGPV